MGVNAKRVAHQNSQESSKRRKVAPPLGTSVKPAKSAKAKGKQRALERTIIDVPRGNHDSEDSDLDNDALGFIDEFGAGALFLQTLDESAISRSKREQDRLHRLDRPVRRAPVDDDLPSVNSHTDDEETWSSDIGKTSRSRGKHIRADSDVEMSYELRDGQIQRTGPKIVVQAQPEEDSEEGLSEQAPEPEPTREDITTGARFGRLSVIDVISNPSRKLRIQIAKEQIAGICQEIVADPENTLGLLRRLHTFSLPEVSSPVHPEPVTNDPYIRKLTMLSQLAVFKDIIPGYRIRELTDKEKAERTSQMVSRTREWEQGLVSVYQNYLKCLSNEMKTKSGLEDVALRCLCTLLVEVTHFNFRVNVASAIVARLSKKSWDECCIGFRADETGVPSLEIVRLLNRMIKERRFNVHSKVLNCLLHLRLKTELGVRASEAKVEREEIKREKMKQGKKSKGKGAESTHLSKKAKKALKERKEIEKEMKEAEASVDKEERVSNQTETLKLLFVLYFRILKNPVPTPLLPAALQGISKYAHLVSIDFFRDLMRVLKDLITRVPYTGSGDKDDNTPREQSHALAAPGESVRHQLWSIITAYELLSGQGEALNVDLSDFTTQLYTLVLSLSLAPEIDATPSSDAPSPSSSPPVSDLLFRALHLAFASRAAVPPWRAAAFAKRLLTAALHWPGAIAFRALEFVTRLVTHDPRLEALLSTEESTVDGIYRPDVEDPQLSNPFATSAYELHLLRTVHVDAQVREAAANLANYVRT
ncbi:nucleolar complex-associated protein-domain-containing protein [Multifurca ochricompacta]|uniref:Nucleolar complex-associated protein 3 n=1 Tax=Multifurca ochricompacta TaxID=376703 RepID=A0AAD4QQ74_9AGAM|nr:nucleolar complex-associated protein-domain-containing protein [Multifurca ochricompacta]